MAFSSRARSVRVSSFRIRGGVVGRAGAIAGALLILVPLVALAAPRNINGFGVTLTEDFGTLASSGTSSDVPPGWTFSETGTNADATYAAGTGSGNTGNTYSFGSTGSDERAFGGLQSGSLNPTIGAAFTNNTGGTITDLSISYTGEQWRLGTSGRTDRIDFQYSLNATGLTDGSWTDVDALDFIAPNSTGTVGLRDGNAAANRTAISSAISGLTIGDGATFWIRWLSFDASGADDGLAVDDFGVSATGTFADAAPVVTDTTPDDNATNVALDSDVTVTFSEPVALGSGAFDLTCDDSGPHTVAASTTDDTTWTFDPDADFAFDETCTVTIENTAVTDLDTDDPPDEMAADHTFSFDTASVPVAIHDVQGAAHLSPLVGDVITLEPGIVTARTNLPTTGNGFYLQAFDADVDADPATSEAIFVFTSSVATVSVGDEVSVTGRVTEFRPGGSSSANLTTTEISSPTITTLSSGNDLPAATVIGAGGRTPPTMVIEDDASGSVETSGVFDPAQDGIDFYESLEAMRVQVNDAVAVGPRNAFGEIPVIADGGAGAGVRTPRGGIVIRPTDFNPERIILDDVLSPTPLGVDVGDTFPDPILGVMDYSFSNFKLLVTATPGTENGGLTREVTDVVAGEGEFTTAAFNVENLDPGDGPQFAELAGLIVDHLRSPDIVALEEIQDDNGAVNDSTTDASLTAATLIAAIESAGGPTYDYRDIDPIDDQDGGQPGGNIRVGFLFRTDRGLSFVDRPGGGPTTPTTVVSGPDGPELSFSPGRIQPNDAAFDDSRKPLAGEFSFNGEAVFVIANHFNSKGGDQPLFGRFQPPTLSSEVQRLQQAAIVNDFVEAILAEDANANVVVLGDLNDFHFSPPLQEVAGDDLNILIETLPVAERYTYVFEGNSQTLDHILTSDGIEASRTGYDVVHVNAEFHDQASDHDPSVARYLVGVPTTKADCKKGGWQTFTNPSFPDQGTCVSWVNHH